MDTAIDWFGGDDRPAAESERLAALYDLDVPHGEYPAIDWFRGLARMTGGPVLELGVGTGRVAIPLAKDGHEVVGIDRSEAMLKRAEAHARRARVTVRLVESDMRTFSLDRAFALITIPFNTFLMLTPDDRWACLARCREHLAPAGRLALDVFQPDPNKIAGVDGGVREEWRRRDPETGGSSPSSRARARMWTRRTSGGGSRTSSMAERSGRSGREATLHFLYRREAELLFPAAGFELDSLHGDYDGSPVDATSPHLLIVARRKERGARPERRRR